MNKNLWWAQQFIGFFLVFFYLPSSASPIKDDEFVQFMSGPAKLADDGSISANVILWVFEKELRPGSQAALALWMRLDLADLSAEDQESFRSRTQLFRIDSERNKKITLKFPEANQKTFPLTDSSGLSHKKIKLKLERKYQHGDKLNYSVVMPANDKREFNGKLVLVSEQGVSVISDIDDTIKDSHVLDKQLLLRNTFVNPLHAVSGMSDWYQHLLNQNPTMSFHYVSSSPIQLYPLLDEFLQQEHFPAGSLHLRQIKLIDELFKEGSSSRRHKQQQIRSLLNQFPKRKFILVGDSGESDPEIYATIARKYPAQIHNIYIRNVTDQNADNPRYQKTFAGLNKNQWKIFTEPTEI